MPPGTLAKNDTMSRTRATSGMSIIPFMPWTMKPTTSSNGASSASMAALSSTPPSSTQMPSPATA